MIRVVPDVAAPLTVAGVNIVGRTAMPEYHDILVYGMTVLGYVSAFMNWGGDFVKQVGVASLPLTADKIYERVKGGVGSKLSMRKVARYPASAPATSFRGVRLI